MVSSSSYFWEIHVHKLARLVFLRKGVIINEKVQDSMYFAFCLLLNFFPLARISALFAPIALFGCPSYDNLIENAQW